VTAVTRSDAKRAAAFELGADAVVTDGQGLKDAGGVDVLMHTSSNHAAVVDALTGLRPWGKLVMNGIAFDDMQLPALALVSNSHQVVGSAHNGIEYLVEALDFVARGAVKPWIEVFPSERVQEAYDRVVAGDVRFKAVVTY
jgi:D-arabinose 1-dehydrogenase-like Zn-dependent alcohol dehydrogenase